MNPFTVRTLIADLATSLAEFGIAVHDGRHATVTAGGCCALASFSAEASLPDGVLVHWVSAHGLTSDAQPSSHRLNTAATAILNDAVDRLLAEMGYSTRPVPGGTVLVTGTRRRPDPPAGWQSGGER